MSQREKRKHNQLPVALCLSFPFSHSFSLCFRCNFDREEKTIEQKFIQFPFCCCHPCCFDFLFLFSFLVEVKLIFAFLRFVIGKVCPELPALSAVQLCCPSTLPQCSLLACGCSVSLLATRRGREKGGERGETHVSSRRQLH